MDTSSSFQSTLNDKRAEGTEVASVEEMDDGQTHKYFRRLLIPNHIKTSLYYYKIININTPDFAINIPNNAELT